MPELAWAADGTVKVALTGSIFPGLSGTVLEAAARPFKSLVESALGMRGRIVPGGSACTLARKLKEDRVQVGVFQGIEFAWGRQTNPELEPLVICVNQRRTLRAMLLTRAGSSIKKPADLRHKTLAMPSETYEHCRVFLQKKCTDSVPSKKFFKKTLTTADVEEALDDVVDGRAQAALIDGLAWESYCTAKPGCAKRLRVLLSSEPFPCAVIACQKGRFSDDLVRRFRRAMVRARDDRRGRRLLEFLRLSGFEEVPDDYDQLFTSIGRTYPAPH
jgi:ABC-type phosphate/phosphonate transport system substrate-binding protein